MSVVNRLESKEEIKAKTVESILKIQPVGRINKINTNSDHQNSSQQNFNQVYKSMDQNIARVTKHLENGSESGLMNKINSYGMDAQVTYYSINSSQRSFYS